MRDAIERAMASAGLTTTIGDVSAFAAEHMADRAEKRRYAVDAALAAAAERKRLDEVFEPALVRARMRGSTSPPAPASHPSMGAGTLPESPEALVQPIELVARLTPRISDPAPQPSSYATLGSAAFEASQHTSASTQRSSKGGVLALAVALVAAVALAAGVRFNLIHPDLSGHSSSEPLPPAMPVSKPPLPAPSPPPVVAPAPAPATSKPGDPSYSMLPTVAATALPKAGATPTTPDPAQRPRPTPTRWQPQR
jgi:hypothetical protein